MNAEALQRTPLRDINDVAPFGPSDEECFAEVRAVLERHGALDRFGLCLLHQHFNVAEDEVLVERVDPETRTLTTQPMKRDEVGETVETSWRLNSTGTMQVCDVFCQRDRDADGNRLHLPNHYKTP